MRRVLVTGFEPFGGHRRNPSQEIAEALDGRAILGRTVVGGVLPCVFRDSKLELARLFRRHRPELVIALGLAETRFEITPERVAINVIDARIPDNAGSQPIDRPIVRGAPAAYWSTLPVKAIVAALQARGVPASVSQTAGTFVCNYVFFCLMHELLRHRGVRGGFIHVPQQLRRTTGSGSDGSVTVMADAIATAIAVSLRRRRDVRTVGGKAD